jgi:hypothetical protein
MNSVTARTAMTTPAYAKRLLDATTITNQPEEADAVEDFCVDAPKLTTSLASGSAMDVQSLCLSQDFESMTEVEKVVTSVSFSKPDSGSSVFFTPSSSATWLSSARRRKTTSLFQTCFRSCAAMP